MPKENKNQQENQDKYKLIIKQLRETMISVQLTAHELDARISLIDDRLQVLEAFFNNIRKITTTYEEN